MFDLKKWLTSYISPMTYWKRINQGLQLVIPLLFIFALIFTVYNVFFKKHTTQNIVAEQGSNINIYNKEDKAWWVPSPFVDIYAYKENDRQGVGGRFGAHWSF